jgi:glycosyltransferase involved in cell wall biosynthesis
MIHADFYGIFAARVAGIGKVISSRHNQDWFRTRFPYNFLNLLLWGLTNRGIAISEAVKSFVEKTEMGAAGKLRVIHYGLDLIEENSSDPERRRRIRAEWGIPAEAPLVGSICRLIEQKGLSYALTAFAEVSARMPEAHYIIAGDGNLKKSLEQQARDLHRGDRVHFVGWRKDIHAILDAIDVFVAPSLWEGFGLVLLEAMAHALPIIGTTAGALPEIIVNGQTGFMVEPGQSAPLVDPMIYLLSDQTSRLEMGRAGQQRLETMFSVEKMINSTITFYRELYETT